LVLPNFAFSQPKKYDFNIYKGFLWGKKKEKSVLFARFWRGEKKHLPNSSTMVPMCSQNIKRILILFTRVSVL
jgi:hypothetical protein